MAPAHLLQQRYCRRGGRGRGKERDGHRHRHRRRPGPWPQCARGADHPRTGRNVTPGRDARRTRRDVHRAHRRRRFDPDLHWRSVAQPPCRPRLAQGKTLDDILRIWVMWPKAWLCAAALAIARRTSIDMPITQAVCAVLSRPDVRRARQWSSCWRAIRSRRRILGSYRQGIQRQAPPSKPCCRQASYTATATALERLRLRLPGRMRQAHALFRRRTAPALPPAGRAFRRRTEPVAWQVFGFGVTRRAARGEGEHARWIRAFRAQAAPQSACARQSAHTRDSRGRRA